MNDHLVRATTAPSPCFSYGEGWGGVLLAHPRERGYIGQVVNRRTTRTH
jgi:hypothetical protein